MKTSFPLAGLTLLLLLFILPARAAAPSYQVEVKCELKRLEVKRSVSKTTESADENWGYLVTITNHSFKEIPDLRADYVLFSKHERFGSDSGEVDSKRTPGSKVLGSLQINGKASFETEPVALKAARLKGGWYYPSGAKRKAKDEVSGIWVRVYSGSELINESAQPASLKTQEKWEG